jgi:nitroreductase
MLIAATSMGFVANWLTEWPAFNPLVAEKLGLQHGERIAGFIYIGTSVNTLEERVRPELGAITSWF